jgi:shikimate 5-dehydrogenase
VGGGGGGPKLLCLGGGGAAAALLLHLIEAPDPDDRPRRCLLVERDGGRLAQLRALLAGLPTAIEFDLRLHDEPVRNDALLATLRPASVVINATGMGKDHPGSPLTDAVRFPERSVAWDLNYRGELRFLEQARSQPAAAGVRAADGWLYFLHGWSQVIEHVLQTPIDGPLFERMAGAAAGLR